jgi:hypothetical protein
MVKVDHAFFDVCIRWGYTKKRVPLCLLLIPNYDEQTNLRRTYKVFEQRCKFFCKHNSGVLGLSHAHLTVVTAVSKATAQRTFPKCGNLTYRKDLSCKTPPNILIIYYFTRYSRQMSSKTSATCVRPTLLSGGG